MLTRLSIASCLLAVACFAQCPNGTTFPGAADTDASLSVAVNNLGTNLTATLSPSSTTMIVSSTTGWGPNITATVDTAANTEIVFVTAVVSSTVLAISHPCEGTAAISHSAGVPVVANVTAYAGSTGMKSAIMAIEQRILDGGLGGTITPGQLYQVPYYSTAGPASVVAGDSGLTYNQPAQLLTTVNLNTAALVINTLSGTQCLQEVGGVVSGTGSACGSGGGGSGTVNAGSQFQIAIYPNSGSSATVGGAGSGFTISSGVMSVSALTVAGITGVANNCLQANTSGVVSGVGAPCGAVNSGTANQVAYYASTGTTLSGHTGFTFNGTTLTAANMTISGISGTQCLHAISGAISGTGGDCASLTAGSTFQIPIYSSASVLAGNANLTFNTGSSLLAASNATFGTLADTGITGSTQCVHANSAGAFSGSGSDCPIFTGGVAGEIPYFFNGTTITGSSSLTWNNSTSTMTVNQAIVSSTLTGNGTSTFAVVRAGLTPGWSAVYRCTTAGTLPVGTLTIAPSGGNCTASVITDLQVQ